MASPIDIKASRPSLPAALAMPPSAALHLSAPEAEPLDGFDSTGPSSALGALGRGQSTAMKGLRLSDALAIPFKERMRILADTPGNV
jgi:hypothetical protein